MKRILKVCSIALLIIGVTLMCINVVPAGSVHPESVVSLLKDSNKDLRKTEIFDAWDKSEVVTTTKIQLIDGVGYLTIQMKVPNMSKFSTMEDYQFFLNRIDDDIKVYFLGKECDMIILSKAHLEAHLFPRLQQTLLGFDLQLSKINITEITTIQYP